MRQRPRPLLVTAALVLLLTAAFSAAAKAVGAPESDSVRSSVYVPDPADTSPLKANTVVRLALTLAAKPSAGGKPAGADPDLWLSLHARKQQGDAFHVWLGLSGPRSNSDAPAAAWPELPPSVALPGVTPSQRVLRRYVVRMEAGMPGASVPGQAVEFQDRATGIPALPSTGAWPWLLPSTDAAQGNASGFPDRIRFLGHAYIRAALVAADAPEPTTPPADIRLVRLRTDAWVGVASNTRQVDETRRYDGSDYALRTLTRADYREMAEAGMNCFRVDSEQRPWVEDLESYYWGIGGREITFPETLYDARYLGPTLFLDEPAVHTRDAVLRPRLQKEPEFRASLGIPAVLEAFRATFAAACTNGAANELVRGLAARDDLSLGDMRFPQANLYSWETMVASAAHELSWDRTVPSAMVFEPPGRFGTRRTLPEMNMAYGCQIPADNPNFLIDIVYGFLRGAARRTGKTWGTSIYGAVDRADAAWFLARAHAAGATRFFFWDNYTLACVPYAECLALARQVRGVAENRPARDLDRLRSAAEVAILLPPGYDLGHVHMGKGNLWGLPELNLERTNRSGIKYREVMGNVFTEIERCERYGVAFDLMWDLPGKPPEGYRELVRVREDGRVEVLSGGRTTVYRHARIPSRPAGNPPRLRLTVSGSAAATADSPRRRFTACATVEEGSAPVYFTYGTDPTGIYGNAAVQWELYGPQAWDYRWLTPPVLKPVPVRTACGYEATMDFVLDQPGTYRLRVATTDTAGRSTVVWETITIPGKYAASRAVSGSGPRKKSPTQAR